jgi:hypothetical protein
MVIKLKEGCLVELNNIKVVNVEDTNGIESYNIKISYFDEKKNPNAYIGVESKEEGIKLVDYILSKLDR